jgi:hypothetical protein
MSKTLYNTLTQKTLRWNRADNETVVGREAHLVELELIQETPPDSVPDGKTMESDLVLDLDAGTLTEKWAVRDMTAEEIAANRKDQFPDAEAVDVRDWLLDQGITAADVESQIVAMFPDDETARAKALNRWEYAVNIPRDHPLVVSIGAALGFTPDELDTEWTNILSR